MKIQYKKTEVIESDCSFEITREEFFLSITTI